MERIRPTASPNEPGSRPTQSSTTSGAVNHVTKAVTNPSLASKVLVILLIIASVVFIANMTFQLLGKNTPGVGNARVDRDRYQAVFLTNGQVYFGKLEDVTSMYTKLTDIYYLQVNQATGEDGEPLQNAPDQQQPQISLAKLGNELHGPEDVMYITRDQILFWENLKGADDSQVTKAIEEFKAQGD